jgi:hypothetical protein
VAGRVLWLKLLTASSLAAVAGCAGSLPVAPIPEEIVVTTVRNDVVDARRQGVAADVANSIDGLREELTSGSLPIAIVAASTCRRSQLGSRGRWRAGLAVLAVTRLATATTGTAGGLHDD